MTSINDLYELDGFFMTELIKQCVGVEMYWVKPMKLPGDNCLRFEVGNTPSNQDYNQPAYDVESIKIPIKEKISQWWSLSKTDSKIVLIKNQAFLTEQMSPRSGWNGKTLVPHKYEEEGKLGISFERRIYCFDKDWDINLELKKNKDIELVEGIKDD